MLKSVQLTGDVNGNSAVDAGDILTYIITVANMGSTPATTLNFTDIPDANTTLVAGSTSVNVATTITETSSVTVQVASLAAGASFEIRFQVTVNNPLPAGVTQIANQGHITGDNIPDTPTDDPSTPTDNDPTVIGIAGVLPPTATPGTPQIGVFDPAISKVGFLQEGGIGLPGENLTWEFTITNTGTAAGTNVIVTDVVASELRVNDAATEVGSYDISGQTVTFTIPVLNPGQVIHAFIYTTVLKSPLNVNNSVSLSGTGPSGTIETSAATAHVEGQNVTGLPNTGYAPQEPEKHSSLGWIAAIGALGMLGVTVFWRLRKR
jgi:uncharacterized repeat protein (TIGR01451 family)